MQVEEIKLNLVEYINIKKCIVSMYINYLYTCNKILNYIYINFIENNAYNYPFNTKNFVDAKIELNSINNSNLNFNLIIEIDENDHEIMSSTLIKNKYIRLYNFINHNFKNNIVFKNNEFVKNVNNLKKDLILKKNILKSFDINIISTILLQIFIEDNNISFQELNDYMVENVDIINKYFKLKNNNNYLEINILDSTILKYNNENITKFIDNKINLNIFKNVLDNIIEINNNDNIIIN